MAPPGEEPDDIYVGCFTIDMTPPEIASQTPLGTVGGPVDHVDLAFSEEVTNTALRSERYPPHTDQEETYSSTPR